MRSCTLKGLANMDTKYEETGAIYIFFSPSLDN